MVETSRPTGTRSRAKREQAALLLARTLVDRTRSLYRELEQSTGAPVQAHRALAGIAAEPGIQSSQLANLLGMQRSAVSHLLKTLAQQGWIERRRSGDDQRSVHLFVTQTGNGVVGSTAGRVVGVLQSAVEQLDNTQLAELERSLQALLPYIAPPAPGMRPASRGRPARTTTR
ncbi:MAG: MarR family transcriptional regulator [Pseudomonadota bacterium]